jgi:hypothetical protein
VRQEQIRIFAEGLRGNKLRGYVNLMVCEAEVIYFILVQFFPNTYVGFSTLIDA